MLLWRAVFESRFWQNKAEALVLRKLLAKTRVLKKLQACGVQSFSIKLYISIKLRTGSFEMRLLTGADTAN